MQDRRSDIGQDTLGEYLAENGKTQLHIAETEKYAHVTFFFNCGRETPYKNEERILVPSPKVATYDLKPEMSAYEVKDKLVEAINTQKFDFIVVNYANGDMVGHTGIYSAIEKAVTAIDNCVKDTVEAAKANGYEAVFSRFQPGILPMCSGRFPCRTGYGPL